MLGKLKDMFGGKPAPGGKPYKRKVNLNRRFSNLTETSSQGSMSKVYRAVDNDHGRAVCLKVQIPDKNEAAAARAYRASRPPEGEIGAGIVHPNVVRTLDHGLSTRNEPFVVMEYLDGRSLQFVRELGMCPTLPEKVEILAQAAEGLAAVHSAGFLHHDVNPRNYMVTRDGQVKLFDFGLSVPDTPEFHRPGNRTGTLAYMAPELIRRDTIDARIDVFSFGAVAFEFLTGKLPYDAASSLTAMVQRINSEPLDPALANPDLPPELLDLLRKLTARKPEKRWPKMATVAAALRQSIGLAPA